uniref:Proteoglycan 4b n=1 Tax=Scophthalmus maximus TaxID=52904 RepID=A0A8D3D059_SCOMX
MKMSSAALRAVTLLTCALTFGAAQTSCKGRCGAEYYRGYMCQCDYTCLPYGECCKDYESQCTTKNSCKGRCGETFKRGRPCSCDSSCIKYKQCCPDYKTHCDAEEPTLTEAKEQPSPVSEENIADDHMIPLVSPTSSLPDDSSDDMFSNILPTDEFTDNAPEEASPAPESTSGYGPADHLDPGSTEPTLEPDALEFITETVTVFPQTEATPSQDEPTQADADSTDPISSTNPGATAPQPTTAVDHVSSRATPTSDPHTEVSPTASSPELETEGQGTVQPEDDIFPEAQKTEPTEASSHKPEVTTLSLSTLASMSTGPTEVMSEGEMSQLTTFPASLTQDSTAAPDATTSNPETPSTENNSDDATTGPPPPVQTEQDASTSVSPAGPTHVPSSTAAAPADATDDVTQQVTAAGPVKVTPELTGRPQPPEPTPSQPQDKPEASTPSPAKPTLVDSTPKPEAKPLDVDSPGDYQADDSNDTNLCSGRPVGAVTTLGNGTTVVFRGHYFWFLGRNREPGPARGITQVWGVPSPVDTVFTRCNCHGKTYIFKGAQYWRYENDALDPGYPKVVATGFDGLRGQITAALSVPQHKRRRESVYFFKRGGLVQKYSYQFGTSPTCGRRAQYAVHTVRNRIARQAVSLLGPTINIRTSWRGFPTTITAAVSVPNTREPEGYKYYVFSRTKSYNVRMDGEHPVVAAPAANVSPQSNNFVKCPKN